MNLNGEIRIVVLSRGWIYIGKCYCTDLGQTFRIDQAYNIRRWGTERGLGQIAINGPTENTVLDFYGEIELEPINVLHTIVCDEEKWSEHYKAKRKFDD